MKADTYAFAPAAPAGEHIAIRFTIAEAEALRDCLRSFIGECGIPLMRLVFTEPGAAAVSHATVGTAA